MSPLHAAEKALCQLIEQCEARGDAEKKARAEALLDGLYDLGGWLAFPESTRRATSSSKPSRRSSANERQARYRARLRDAKSVTQGVTQGVTTPVTESVTGDAEGRHRVTPRVSPLFSGEEKKNEEIREIESRDAREGVTGDAGDASLSSVTDPVTQGVTKSAKRASRLPDNFSPKEETVTSLVAEGHRDPLQHLPKFRDHWVSQPGAKGVKLDWEATFRNWVRNEKRDFQPARGRIVQRDDHKDWGFQT